MGDFLDSFGYKRVIVRTMLSIKRWFRIALAYKRAIVRIVLAHKRVIVRIVLDHNRGDCQDSVGS